MRSLVLLTLLGCACAASFLQDTPEVVAERARFQQLFNAQAAAAAAAPDDPGTGRHQQYRHQAAPQQHFSHHQPATHHNQHATYTPRWTGPVAATVPAGLPGSTAQVADTADVSAARNAFLSAYRAQVAATTGQNVAPHHSFSGPTHHSAHSAPRHFNALPSAPAKWTGPVAATVPAGVDGRVTPVSDTADVAAAKAAFFNNFNAALSATQPAAANQYRHAAPVQHHQQAQPRWTGPVAATVPAGLPGATSQVGQTADVAAATAAFHQAYNNAVAATTGRRF